MATKKTATKSTSKAKLNIDVDLNSKNNKKTTKKATKKTLKTVKNASAGSIAIALVLLIVGLGVGLGAWFFVCKDDGFLMNGQEEITLTLDEKYADDGVKIVEFGQDKSSSFELETNLKKSDDGKYYSDEVGTFYITYKATTTLYGKIFNIQKIRLITFVEASDDVVEVD